MTVDINNEQSEEKDPKVIRKNPKRLVNQTNSEEKDTLISNFEKSVRTGSRPAQFSTLQTISSSNLFGDDAINKLLQEYTSKNNNAEGLDQRSKILYTNAIKAIECFIESQKSPKEKVLNATNVISLDDRRNNRANQTPNVTAR